MPRALFIAAFFFTMTPILISMQWLLDKMGLPGWGFIATNYYRVLRSHPRRPRACRRRTGARPRGAARLQSRLLGRYPGDRLDRAGRLHRQVRGARIGRWSASPPSCSARYSSTARKRQQTGDAIAEIVSRLAGGTTDGAVRRRHLERRQPRAAVPLGADRRGARKPALALGERHPHSADVDLLHRPQRHPDGPAAPPADRLVRRSRLHAAHQGADGRAARSTQWSPSASRSPADGATDRKAMAKSLEATVRRLAAGACAAAPRPRPGCAPMRAS